MNLSIITINRNNAAGLEKTLQSVAAQTFKEFEYIIVDGASTDGSVDVIKRYEPQIAHLNWVSEPDLGIYNAMNKGLRRATGDYVQILNSGDSLAADDVVERMLQALEDAEQPTILYGNMVKCFPDGHTFVDKSFEGREITMYDMFRGTLNHSPAYIPRDLFEKYGYYDEQLKIVSDWKWYIQAVILNGEKPRYVDLNVTLFDMTGISETNKELLKEERKQVLEQLFPKSRLRACQNKHGWARMRKMAHEALAILFGGVFKFLCKIHVFKPKVLVMMDGGICSQMHQYLIGQAFAEQGERVGYELSFYQKVGMDVDRRYPRTFELEEMFPDIRVATFGRFENWFYRTFLKYSSPTQTLPDAHDKHLAPIYLTGYYQEDDQLFAEQFKRLFKHVRMAEVTEAPVNSEGHTCAIHVRRGDLASGNNPWYGGVPDDYFLRAIAYVEERHPHTKFHFFSDEMDYVENHLVPKLTVDYELVNGQRKAFEDLMLLSRYKTIIASQGNFGKYAAMFDDDSLLILHDDKFAKPWLARKRNVVCLE